MALSAARKLNFAQGNQISRRHSTRKEEIVMSYPSLELGDVYAIINYYVHNRTEVDAYLSQREAESARIREENEKRFPQKGIRARLLARR
jgi:hypothetical protein